MAGMEEALKNIMMQRAMKGGGAPTRGSMPMAPGGQGRPMPTTGGGSTPMGGGGINPAVLKAVMAAKAGGKGKPTPKSKTAPKGKAVPKKAAPKGNGKAPVKKAAK